MENNKEKLYKYSSIEAAAKDLRKEYGYTRDENGVRTAITFIDESDLMYAVGANLYYMAPNHNPRNADIIMRKLRNTFRLIARNEYEWYTFDVIKGKEVNFIHDILFGIKEFRDLNLTQQEYDYGVSVFDSNRESNIFIDNPDTVIPGYMMQYVDLNVFVGQVLRSIKSFKEMNDFDEKDYDRTTKGKITCKHNCKKLLKICCESCKYKDCEDRCEGSSSTCNNVYSLSIQNVPVVNGGKRKAKKIE